MASNVASRVLDLGLNVLDTEADKIFICSAEPTTFAQATSTLALGNKAFSVGGAFGSPVAATPNGEKVSSTAITDGTVTTAGTATNWAAVDSVNSRLLAVGALAASYAVVVGPPFQLPSFDIRIPNQ